MPLTTQQIESRRNQNETHNVGYRAASQAKGCMLTEAEMIRVRTAIDSGTTPEQLAAEFTPPVPRPVRDMRETLDAYARLLAKLTEDMNAYGAVVHHLQESVGKLEAEVAALKKVKKAGL